MSKIPEEIMAWADKALSEKRRLRLIAPAIESAGDGKKNTRPAAPWLVTVRMDEDIRGYYFGSEPEGAGKDVAARKKAIYENAKRIFLDEKEVTNSIPLKHLMRIDLSKDYDAALFYVMLTHTEVVACSKAEYNPATHRYYIEDQVREISFYRSSFKSKSKCFELVGKISLDELPAYYRIVIGRKPAEYLSENIMMGELEKEADSRPDEVLKILEDKDVAVNVFAAQLMNKGIVQFDKQAQVYRAGSTKIATGFKQMIDYLTDEENHVIVGDWAKQVKNKSFYGESLAV